MKKLTAIVFICLGLMACGQTGELYLPEAEANQTSTQSSN